MSAGSAWPPPSVELATAAESTAKSDAPLDRTRVDSETERLIESLRQRHLRLLMNMRPGISQRPQVESLDEAGAPAVDPAEAAPHQTKAASVGVVRLPAPAIVGVAVPGGAVNDVTKPSADVNREVPLLVDYKEAAYLLSLCRPRQGDTSPEQAETRGVNALKQRVASGRIPARCIKRSGRRVQFVRVALVEWVSGRGKVQA